MARGVSFDVYDGPAGVGGAIFGGENHTEPLYLFGGGLYVNGAPVSGQVRKPGDWAHAAGCDYWAVFGPSGALTAGNAHEIIDYGWTATSLSFGGGVTGDFLSSADDDPPYLDFGASGDLLQSPILFGSYAHGQQAEGFLGATPTVLGFECYAAFPTITANETTSGFGFVRAAASTAGDQIAFIHRNNDLFRIRSGPVGAADDGPATDNNWHLWKVEATFGSTFTWYQDGVSLGTLGIANDSWPVAFGAHSFTTNRLRIAWIHCYYR